ncbi:MAG: hypothetical protein U5N86_11585 [Planctomycetota bacterium]|nr:hypothetical protein [Planctomycetota bacterium]
MDEQLAADGVLDLDGLPLSRELHDSLCKMNYDNASEMLECTRVGVLKVGASASPAAGEKAVLAAFTDAEVLHLRAKPFWNQTDHEPLPCLSARISEFVNERRSANA